MLHKDEEAKTQLSANYFEHTVATEGVCNVRVFSFRFHFYTLIFSLIKIYHWNNRHSRRVFLCFYSAIFQLTSAKFQTFAYNSRTVGSSNIKFGQQFEINELYGVPNFEAIGQVTSVLEPENGPASLA